MATRAKAVIGAAFGDEGKGLVTDAFAADAGADGVVVRFNGGAQAGHTVVAPDGRRHVFSHFGSGSFAGAATFLSRHFICNPILFQKELAALHRVGVRPRVLVDADALVTTPYDMMINQAAEASRGNGRHGSCGIGIGETVERSLDPEFRITARDLSDRRRLADLLEKCRRQYVLGRLSRLRVAPHSLSALLDDDGILEHFLDEAFLFMQQVEVGDSAFLRRVEPVVFEGAQGLLLDQERGTFPYVTRSYTGIRNVLELAREAGIRRLDVTYVSRCYLTRHGAGPLPHELAGLPYAGVVDGTNVPNPHQGHLRFGLLDLDLLRQTVLRDFGDAALSPEIEVHAGAALTCLDQCGGSVRAVSGCRMRTLGVEEALYRVRQALASEWLIGSFGSCRNNVRYGIGRFEEAA